MSLSAVGDDAHYGRPEKFRYDDLIPPSPAALRLPDPQHVQLFAFIPFWADHGLYPSVLEKAHFSRDPLAAELRALWEEAGLSTALSPVFGGYTANAEFEVLCGFPVLDTGVKFERRLTNDVPCLPRILRDIGFTTVASHPNIAVFWNRVNAYRRVGFTVPTTT